MNFLRPFFNKFFIRCIVAASFYRLLFLYYNTSLFWLFWWHQAHALGMVSSLHSLPSKRLSMCLNCMLKGRKMLYCLKTYKNFSACFKTLLKSVTLNRLKKETQKKSKMWHTISIKPLIGYLLFKKTITCINWSFKLIEDFQTVSKTISKRPWHSRLILSIKQWKTQRNTSNQKEDFVFKAKKH